MCGSIADIECSPLKYIHSGNLVKKKKISSLGLTINIAMDNIQESDLKSEKSWITEETFKTHEKRKADVNFEVFEHRNKWKLEPRNNAKDPFKESSETVFEIKSGQKERKTSSVKC